MSYVCFFAKCKILHRKTSWYIDLAAVQSDIAAAAKKKRNRYAIHAQSLPCDATYRLTTSRCLC